MHVCMRTSLGLLWIAACRPGGDAPSAETGPPAVETAASESESEQDERPLVVVLWATDTLSARAALDGGLCGTFQAAAAGIGEVACLPGAVSPATSTSYTHARLLWPTHRVGLERRYSRPDCVAPSVLGVVASALHASITWGSDNPTFEAYPTVCDGVTTPWSWEADEPFLYDGATVLSVEEAQRPGRLAIEAVLDHARRGEPVVAYVNDYEVGGHMPRCWYDPEFPACAELFALAVASGVYPADGVARDFWLDNAAFDDLIEVVDGQSAADAAVSRALMYDTIVRQVEHYGATRTGPRFATLIQGLADAGVADRSLVVVFGDHGETPCVRHPLDGVLRCQHGSMPTEWTAQVPVAVYPASAASAWESAGLVASDGAPWSTTNLAYALVSAVGGERPTDWPAPEPIGRATSWVCGNDAGALFVSGSAAVSCTASGCGTYGWALPDGPDAVTVPVSPTPPELLPYTDGAWLSEACAL